MRENLEEILKVLETEEVQESNVVTSTTKVEEKNVEEINNAVEKEMADIIEKKRVMGLTKSGINPYTQHNLAFFDGVKKFKSVWRAMRRGHASVNGEVFPDRPFNNRANTSKKNNTHSRTTNENKKLIYGELKKAGAIS